MPIVSLSSAASPPEDLNSFPEVTQPLMAPPTLEALLGELAKAHREGNFLALADAARDALGFTTRYFAGVLLAACRALDCLPAQLADVGGTSNVEDSARHLMLCLERLEKSPQRLAKKLCQIFLETNGEHRRFTQALAPVEGEFSIVSFCRSPRDERPGAEPFTQALRWLDAWMNSCFGFFLESEQRFEPGPFFGQVEQVVVFEQHTLPTGLTLRLKELRPAAPDTTSLVLDSDKAPALPMLGAPIPVPTTEPEEIAPSSKPAPPAFELGARKSQAPPAEKAVVASAPLLAKEAPPPKTQAPLPVPEPVPTTPIAPAEAVAIVDFLQLKLTQNPAKPHEPRVAAPKGWLDCDIDQAGMRKNQAGDFGYSGYLWIRLSGEGETEIEGTATCENSRVEISPATFKGVQTRIVYWVHPDEIRKPRGHVLIKAHNLERQIPVWKLLPDSSLANFSSRQILAMLFAPGLIGSLYTCWIFWASGGRIEADLHELLRDQYSRFINPYNPLSLRASGVGFVDLRIMPQMEAALLLFFCLAWLAPLGASMVYSRIARHEKKNFGMSYGLALVAPSLFYLAMWRTPLVHGQLFHHPDFRFLDFRVHLAEFFLLNLLSAISIEIWTSGFFHRHLNGLGRFVVVCLALFAFGTATLVLVYGRSWLGWF